MSKQEDISSFKEKDRARTEKKKRGEKLRTLLKNFFTGLSFFDVNFTSRRTEKFSVPAWS
jgi:hypothetical protein